MKQERGSLLMLIKVRNWRRLTSKEKFELLLLHANLNVIGEQVIEGVKQRQKNKSNAKA